jgi:hypothetical protein
VARIQANATQEYLFQFAISTIEGCVSLSFLLSCHSPGTLSLTSVKADALFSYQPPFNILAFLILKPASWIVSPRTLHRMNVFLIRLTSFPILILISVYERYWASGQILREHSRGFSQSIFNSLPRHIKNMPIVEALVGSTAADLYEAIFDVELSHDDEALFSDDDDIENFHPLRSYHSRENLANNGRRTPQSKTPRMQSPRRPSPRNESPLRPASTNALSVESPTAGNSAEGIPAGGKSPLSRIFARGPDPAATATAAATTAAAANMDANMKKMERLVEEIKDLPVQQLKVELKELQVGLTLFL